MRTILVNPNFPVGSSLVDPVLQSPVGRNLFFYRAIQKRPRQRFTLAFVANDQYEMESIRELAIFNGGYTPMWFDGHTLAETVAPMLVWIGDGVTTEFILPFKNVFPPTCVFTEDGIVKSDWTMPDDGESGITAFTTAPVSGSEVRWQGSRKIKVRLIVADDAVYGSEERADAIFQESIQLEEIS